MREAAIILNYSPAQTFGEIERALELLLAQDSMAPFIGAPWIAHHTKSIKDRAHRAAADRVPL